MIYTVALLYLAVIVYLEVSHSMERRKWYRTERKEEEKTACGRHFSPHRKAIERIRKNSE